MRRWMVTGWLLTLSFYAAAQEENRFVYFPELQFYSPFEQDAFERLENGEEDLLRLFASIDPDVNDNIYQHFLADFSSHLNKLDQKSFRRARDEKKVELIYEFVNEKVLGRYQEKILFPHLFVNGTFNCLTASAYYGFLMDSLGIEYDFRETYQHVHPVAFPENLQIKIETTDPVAGIEYYDTRLKRQFVNYLIETSIISEEDLNASSVEELFNRYFLPPASIGMKELAGLHYMNDALFKLNIGDHQLAFEQIKKSYYIYPSDRMSTLFQFILGMAIESSGLTEMEQAVYLVYLSRLPEDRLNMEAFTQGMGNRIEQLIFWEDRKEFVDSLYQYYSHSMHEGKVKTIFEFEYYVRRGKSMIASEQLDDGLRLLQEAYDIQPANPEVQNLLLSTLLEFSDFTTSIELMEKIETYSLRFPELNTNGIFINVKMTACLLRVEELFGLENAEEAGEYLSRFESLYETNIGLTPDKRLVGEAYSAAAVYYFKKYREDLAIHYLERGLEISPDNFELEYRLRSIQE